MLHEASYAESASLPILQMRCAQVQVINAHWFALPITLLVLSAAEPRVLQVTHCKVPVQLVLHNYRQCGRQRLITRGSSSFLVC